MATCSLARPHTTGPTAWWVCRCLGLVSYETKEITLSYEQLHVGSNWGLHGLIYSQLKTRVPAKHVAVTTVRCHYHYIVTERRTLIIEANQTPLSNTMAWFQFQDLNMHHVPVNIDISCAFAYKQFVDIHACYMYALHILLKKNHFVVQKLQFHLSFCSLSLPYLQSSTLQIRLL